MLINLTLSEFCLLKDLLIIIYLCFYHSLGTNSVLELRLLRTLTQVVKGFGVLGPRINFTCQKENRRFCRPKITQRWCQFLQICIQKPIQRKAQWKARPRGPQRRPKSKKGSKKEVQGKVICSKMALTNQGKLGLRPFWSKQHNLAHKRPKSFCRKG